MDGRMDKWMDGGRDGWMDLNVSLGWDGGRGGCLLMWVG